MATQTVGNVNKYLQTVQANSLVPVTDALYNLGSGTFRWNEVDAVDFKGTFTPSGLTASRTVATDAKGNLISTNLVGTAAQVSVSANGTATTTVSLPSAITVPGTITVGAGNLQSPNLNFFTATGVISTTSGVTTVLGVDGTKTTTGTVCDGTVPAITAGALVRRDAGGAITAAEVIVGTNATTTGIYLNNSTVSYVPAVLGYYEEYSNTALTFMDGATAITPNFTLKIIRIGSLVMMNLWTQNSFADGAVVPSSPLTAAGAIPTRFQNNDTTSDVLFHAVANSVRGAGLCRAGQANASGQEAPGVLYLYPSVSSFSTPWGATANFVEGFSTTWGVN